MPIEIKAGDDVAIEIQRVDATGAPIDCTGQTVTASIQYQSWSAAFTIEAVDPATGRYRLKASKAQSLTWPAVQSAVADVKFDAVGATRRSRTFAVTISKAITP